MTENNDTSPARIEQHLIGCLIANARFVLPMCKTAKIEPEHMFLAQHRLVLDAAYAVAAKHSPDHVTTVSVCEHLRAHDKLDAVGGEMFIHRLLSDCTTPQHAQYYIAEILKHIVRNVGRLALLSAQEDLANLSLDPSEVVAQAATRLCALNTTPESELNIVDEYEILKKQYIAVKESKRGSMGVPSKWTHVENILGSYVPGELVILAAESSCGKTTFAFNEMIHAAKVFSAPCAFVPIETGRELLLRSMISCEAGTSQFAMRRGQFQDSELDLERDAAARLSKFPIYIAPQVSDIDHIAAWLSYQKITHGIELAFIDYLQLMGSGRNSGHRNESRNHEIECMMTTLRLLTARLKISLVVLSQLSRLPPSFRRNRAFTNPSPSLDRLRDSGSIEQAADVVMFLCKRPNTGLDEFRDDCDWPMEFSIAKHRFGPTGTIKMLFLRNKQTFSDDKTDESLRQFKQRYSNDAPPFVEVTEVF